MSRKNAAPTHGWVIASSFTKYVTIVSFIFVLIMAGIYLRISYAIDRDCSNPYSRRLKLGHFWININAGSTKPGCPKP